jgi:hypothetical protein
MYPARVVVWAFMRHLSTVGGCFLMAFQEAGAISFSSQVESELSINSKRIFYI